MGDLRSLRTAESQRESRAGELAETLADDHRDFIADEIDDLGCFGWLRGVRKRDATNGSRFRAALSNCSIRQPRLDPALTFQRHTEQ